MARREGTSLKMVCAGRHEEEEQERRELTVVKSGGHSPSDPSSTYYRWRREEHLYIKKINKSISIDAHKRWKAK